MTTPLLPKAEADALWASLLAGTISSPARRTRTLTAVRAAKRSKTASAESKAAAASVLAALSAIKAESTAAPSPWRTVGLILPILSYTCKCGHSYRVPSLKLLVRFRHKRNGTIREVAEHPSAFNPHLPRETRTLHHTLSHCEHCFARPEAAHPQLDLFASFEHACPSLPLAIPIPPEPSLVPPPYRPQLHSNETAVRITHCTETLTVVAPLNAHYLPLVPYSNL